MFKRILVMVLCSTIFILPAFSGGRSEARGGARVITVMSEEIDPASQAFYRKAADDFMKANPGVHVALEFPSNTQEALAIRVATGQVPDIVTLQLEAQTYYADQGLLLPADWWIEKYGDDIVENASVPYAGHYWGIPYGLTYEMWWYREDLFREAGIPRPETWDDFLKAAAFFNDPANNFYGVAIPAGPSEWTAWHYQILLWQNGGFVFDTDLKPLVTSQKSREALAFLKELYQYSPPDAPTWEWYDSILAFSTEQVAMAMYGGRLKNHVARDNPALLPNTRVMMQPEKVQRAHPISRKSHVIMKGSKHPDLAKAFIDFIMQEEYLIPFLHTVPIHLTPPLKSLQHGNAYMSHELIQMHPEDMDLVYEAAATAKSLGWESENHPPNPYAGAVNSSGILVEMIQKILLQSTSIVEATEWAERELLRLQKNVDEGRNL